MPQVQVVDVNPNPRTEYTTLEKTLQGFSERNRENDLQQREADALERIYKEYQDDGKNLENLIQAYRTDPNLSPTTRVNSINQTLQFQKHNQDLQRQAEKEIRINQHLQQKEAERINKEAVEEIRRTRNREALEKSGASAEQKALYDVAPIGGQTKIIEDLVESGQRSRTPEGLSSPDLVDYDAGLTPKERVRRQDSRFSLQTPLANANSNALSGFETEEMSLNLLEELTDSGKVGEGLQRLNINPKTGDLFVPQFATPEEQLFVKTVNDFTVKAKESFGARVTNFELDRFMQRLPTLANSTEGRKLILRQMKIINQINQLDKRATQQVFDQYGVRNIDYVDAENKAREKIKDQKEILRKEYYGFEQLAKKEDAELSQKLRAKTLEGYTAMRKPDGTIKQFPTKNVPNLEDKGYKKL